MSFQLRYTQDSPGAYNLVSVNLDSGETEILQHIGPEVSLAFDKETGTLHKHGIPSLVLGWCAQSAKTLRDAGFSDMADALVCITGAFPVEELDKILNNSGYVGRFYVKLQAQA